MKLGTCNANSPDHDEDARYDITSMKGISHKQSKKGCRTTWLNKIQKRVCGFSPKRKKLEPKEKGCQRGVVEVLHRHRPPVKSVAMNKYVLFN